MKYFIQTTRFVPKSYQDFGLVKLNDNIYQMKSDNSLWIQRRLYDLGYGRENGFCRLPLLSFDQLINLAFVSLNEKIDDSTYNYWGAISILIDDFCEDLINYIDDNIQRDILFTKKYFHIYNYIDLELNVPDSLVDRLSDKKQMEYCKKWKLLKSKISDL